MPLPNWRGDSCMTDVATRWRTVHGSRVWVRAFTLIELLVVVAIIALLLAILLPSLAGARDAAKSAKCLANLQQLGRGFHSYAGENADFLCSGQSFAEPGYNYPITPPDPEELIIGLDKVGWMADLVRLSIRPADMLCPGSTGQFTESLWTVNNAGQPFGGYETKIKYMLALGINTNYAQTWYMANTEAVTADVAPNWDRDRSYPIPNRPRCNRGPLRFGFMTAVAPAAVPILGDARQDSAEYYELPGFGRVQRTEAITDGPRWWISANGQQINETNGARFGVQDFQDMGTAHGLGGRTMRDREHNFTKGNILFADGHAATFLDRFTVDAEAGTIREQPDGEFDVYDFGGFGGKVFDGVISIGRRSTSPSRPE